MTPGRHDLHSGPAGSAHSSAAEFGRSHLLDAPPPPEPGSGALGLDPPDTEKPVTELSALEVLFASEADLHRYRDSHRLTGRPDHQFLSSLPYEAARVLGARLLSDRRDTGRLRRLLWDSSALVRGAALTNPRLPWAARKAYTGSSANDQDHYGRATAWDLSQLVRNPELLPGELKNIAALMYAEDKEFWPTFSEAGPEGRAETGLGQAFAELWTSRQAMRSEVVYRVVLHKNCPIDLLEWYLHARPSAQLVWPALRDLVRRLTSANAAGRRLLGRYHARLGELDAALGEQVRNDDLRDLLRHGRPSRDELHAIYAVADLELVIETLGSSRRSASELSQARLIRRIGAEMPHRLPDAWVHLTGPVVAATLASLEAPEARVEASVRADLPAASRRRLERWALGRPDDRLAHQVMSNLTTSTYADQLKPAIGERPPAARRSGSDAPPQQLYQNLMREAQERKTTVPHRTARSRGRPRPNDPPTEPRSDR